MTADEARAKLYARQEAEAIAMEQRNALELIQMTDRHRRAFVELGRLQIAERDFLETARELGDHLGSWRTGAPGDQAIGNGHKE